MAHQFEVLKTTISESAAPGGSKHEPSTETAFSHPRRKGTADDEIAKLVQRIFVLPGSAKAPATVAFCGVEEGVGCSWVAAQAGETLADQVPGSVCLVDVNLRKPSLHHYFRTQVENGFSDSLRDTRPISNFAQRIGKSNLWLIPAGLIGPDSNSLLNPARLHARFSDLRSQFDYLLLDMPAIVSFPLGVLLSQMADGAVLVVGSNSTRRESARMVKESFEAARVPVLGVVLNKRTYPIPEAIYRRL
jgi:Mrp family chromosome partitioning ATPase